MNTFLGSIKGRTTQISKLRKGDSFRKIGEKGLYIYDSKIKLYDKNGEPKGFEYRFYQYAKYPIKMLMSKTDFDVNYSSKFKVFY